MSSAGMMADEGATSNEHHYMLQEMRAQKLDEIRFSSYRTGYKLRFVQKRANLHAIDIWNVIEAFRENGLNTLEPQTEVNVSRLETLVSSLYHNLNKRLPPAQQVNVETSSNLLLNWLLSAYSVENVGKIRVFSIKVALATMCAGKLMDKWRYIFSQISDGNGQLVLWRFEEYLQEVLALPAAVYETPSFHYTPELSANIFARGQKVTVNDFMDTMMSDPGPACLVWLPLLHRLAAVENVVHPIACDACHKENFTGFRYRCQKCHNFQMCQECFWRGRIAGTHTNEHEVKEYTSYKSPSKQIGHSLRKSFRCVPDKGRPNIPRFPDEPEKTLNLSHIVPPSPLPSHNGFGDGSLSAPYDVGSMDSRSTTRSPGKYSSILDASRMDDEHRLIARYAARLAAEARSGRSSSDLSHNDTSRAQRELISQLEAKNKEIMREITRLRVQQELECSGLGSDAAENPALMSELRALRQRKDELEGHLISLQDSRKQLMIQLESLMKLLKNHQASPRSTPNSSPRSTKSPPLTGPVPGSLSGSIPPPSSRSAPPTPGSQMIPSEPGLNLFGIGGYPHTGPPSVSSSPVSGGRSLRNDLLVAADSVTNAMSTLVRELNSEGSDQEDGADGNIRKPLDFIGDRIRGEVDCNFGGLGQLSADTQEQLRKLEHSEQTFARGVGDSALPDWEESLKRWVNR